MKYLILCLAACQAFDMVSAQEIMPPRCNDGAPHESAPEELSQFGFLVGDYMIHLHAWQGDRWSPAKPGETARWNGWYGHGI